MFRSILTSATLLLWAGTALATADTSLLSAVQRGDTKQAEEFILQGTGLLARNASGARRRHEVLSDGLRLAHVQGDERLKDTSTK